MLKKTLAQKLGDPECSPEPVLALPQTCCVIDSMLMNTTLMAESEEKLKKLLMRVKEGSKKAGLKFSIQKTKIMASGPITSWHTEEEKWKQ